MESERAQLNHDHVHLCFLISCSSSTNTKVSTLADIYTMKESSKLISWLVGADSDLLVDKSRRERSHLNKTSRVGRNTVSILPFTSLFDVNVC